VSAVRFDGVTIFTVGHSNRTFEELVGLLWGAGIGFVADVRRFPRSRKFPHFSVPLFGRQLRKCGIGYAHFAELGGRRRALPDSKNVAWRNVSFRGYADHLQTKEFETGLRALHEVLPEGPVVLLCSEAVPWRCHRSVISDALIARGATVLDVIGPGAARPHRLPEFGRRRGVKVTYPAVAPNPQR
jgi:uncharacterized protein (DUF488 family)